jgi:hypothetical protein
LFEADTASRPQEAAAAYDCEARKCKGSAATLNFKSVEIAEAAVKEAVEAYGRENSSEDAGKAKRPAVVGRSGFLGVRDHGGDNWEAILHYNGKGHSLGRFNTKEECAHAYDCAARARKGDGAPTNYETFELGEAAARAAAEAFVPSPDALLPKSKLDKKLPKSGFYGVRQADRSGHLWETIVHYDGHGHNIGKFNTKEEAAAMYDREAFKRKGDDATLNFETLEIAEAAVKAAQEAWVPPDESAKTLQPVGKSGMLGVRESKSRVGGPWEAIIHYNKKGHPLGLFNTKEVCIACSHPALVHLSSDVVTHARLQEAAVAYDAAARKHKPAGAPMNYPSAEVGEEKARAAAAAYVPDPAIAQALKRKPHTGKSGFLGVVQDRKVWNAVLHWNSERHHVGTFNTKEVCACCSAAVLQANPLDRTHAAAASNADC